MSPKTHVSPAKYTLLPSGSRTTMPHGSPVYVPSSALEEWNAFTSVNRTPSTVCVPPLFGPGRDRKSTRLNSSHRCNSYAVFCLKKNNKLGEPPRLNPPGAKTRVVMQVRLS